MTTADNGEKQRSEPYIGVDLCTEAFLLSQKVTHPMKNQTLNHKTLIFNDFFTAAFCGNARKPLARRAFAALVRD
ncbi:hypothetical protein [Propionivibrio limicola]|uniref:hypothetical protein n=1 Tax=Propionivibrio limicola TaxID=167645 RepID=UPI001291DA9F|nr:hypothetical protein [Propionivibrio limicola]